MHKDGKNMKYLLALLIVSFNLQAALPVYDSDNFTITYMKACVSGDSKYFKNKIEKIRYCNCFYGRLKKTPLFDKRPDKALSARVGRYIKTKRGMKDIQSCYFKAIK